MLRQERMTLPTRQRLALHLTDLAHPPRGHEGCQRLLIRLAARAAQLEHRNLGVGMGAAAGGAVVRARAGGRARREAVREAAGAERGALGDVGGDGGQADSFGGAAALGKKRQQWIFPDILSMCERGTYRADLTLARVAARLLPGLARIHAQLLQHELALLRVQCCTLRPARVAGGPLQYVAVVVGVVGRRRGEFDVAHERQIARMRIGGLFAAALLPRKFGDDGAGGFGGVARGEDKACARAAGEHAEEESERGGHDEEDELKEVERELPEEVEAMLTAAAAATATIRVGTGAVVAAEAADDVKQGHEGVEHARTRLVLWGAEVLRRRRRLRPTPWRRPRSTSSRRRYTCH
jgi:hypothetical protein